MVIEPLADAWRCASSASLVGDDGGYAWKSHSPPSVGVPVVSFTFGCPTIFDVVAGSHAAGCAMWATITDAAEALAWRRSSGPTCWWPRALRPAAAALQVFLNDGDSTRTR